MFTGKNWQTQRSLRLEVTQNLPIADLHVLQQLVIWALFWENQPRRFEAALQQQNNADRIQQIISVSTIPSTIDFV